MQTAQFVGSMGSVNEAFQHKSLFQQWLNFLFIRFIEADIEALIWCADGCSKPRRRPLLPQLAIGYFLLRMLRQLIKSIENEKMTQAFFLA